MPVPSPTTLRKRHIGAATTRAKRSAELACAATQSHLVRFLAIHDLAFGALESGAGAAASLGFHPGGHRHRIDSDGVNLRDGHCDTVVAIERDAQSVCNSDTFWVSETDSTQIEKASLCCRFICFS